MTAKEIEHIISNYAFPYHADDIKLIETHISWVILTSQYVYKIKKPVKYSFLDFSTIEKRKRYLERELNLNQRLTSEMYLDILPINSLDGYISIGQEQGLILDYCLVMKRMDETRQMDLLLAGGLVKDDKIVQLAEAVADFHISADKISEGENWKELYDEYADIRSVLPWLEKNIDEVSADKINASVDRVKQYLEIANATIERRNDIGMVIDGHGDLHTRNIFLLDKPVIFDCIEFNDAFRHLDVLSEIAFLVMDIERMGANQLADLFCREYFSRNPVLQNESDEQLFLFYKMHRANVMIKVMAIRASNKIPGSKKFETQLQLLKSYVAIFLKYYAQLFSN